jgi:hypothetical protein
MVRWIAFDDDTAEAVVSRLRRGAAEIQHNSPVEAALATDGPSVIVLPSPNPGRLLIARFTASRKAEAPAPPIYPKNVGPRTGIVAKIPVASEKKPWWRRIVA